MAKEATSTGTGGSGVGSLLAGAVVVLTGLAVYQYRHLFHDYPIHPIILKPHDTAKTLPSQQPMTLDAPSVETTMIHKAEPAPESGSTIKVSTPTSETLRRPIEKVSDAVEKSEERKEAESKKDVIPPQIIDNTVLVELFSEALGDKARGEDHPISQPSDSMTGRGDSLLSRHVKRIGVLCRSGYRAITVQGCGPDHSHWEIAFCRNKRNCSD